MQALINPSDLRWETFRSGGPGGQNQNKVESGCRVTHIPTGISAESRTKSQAANRKLALQTLSQRVSAAFDKAQTDKTSSLRRDQIGSGMRGDKIRTYRFRDNSVRDHRTGKKCALTTILGGDFSQLEE